MNEEEFYAILHLEPTEFEKNWSKKNNIDFDPSIIIEYRNKVSFVYASKEFEIISGKFHWTKEKTPKVIVGYTEKEGSMNYYLKESLFEPKEGYFPIEYNSKSKLNLMHKINKIEKLSFEEVENLFIKKIN